MRNYIRAIYKCFPFLLTRTAARAAAQPRQIALHIAVERLVAENLELVLAARVNVGEIDRLLVLHRGDGDASEREGEWDIVSKRVPLI